MKNKILPPVVLFCLWLLLWEWGSQAELFSSTLIPAPSQVFKALSELRTDFGEAFLSSLKNILAGWALSLLFGNLMAMLLSLSEFLKNAILPFAIFFQTVPIIAVAPLLVIYFGFGNATVIVSSFMVSVFPVLANSLLGLESSSAEQKELFQLHRATRWQTLLKLKLPQAYSSVYAGMKVSAGLAVIGAVAGEFVAGGGLGALIDSARTQQRADIIFAAIILLSLIGLLLVTVLKLMHNLLNRHRPWGLHLKD